MDCKKYLAEFNNDYTWFISPDNEAEALVNAKTLNELRSNQLMQVEGFIKLNESLIKNIAKELMNSDKIETERSLTLLEQVAVPDCPQVKRPKD